jgi:uncharacterized protein
MPAHPLPLSLREELRRQRAAIVKILADRGAHNPRLFGSLARGDDDVASDVDLLVEFANPRTPGEELLDVLGLSEELSEILALRVHVASPRTLRPEVEKQASAEAVPL